MSATTFEPPPTYAEVVLFDKDGKNPRFNPIWLKWFVDVAAFLSGGVSSSITHNDTAGLQGGAVGEEYHLTSSQHTKVLQVE